MEMKVVLVSCAFGNVNPGMKKKNHNFCPPVTKVCVLSAKILTDTEGQTLCIINNQRRK